MKRYNEYKDSGVEWIGEIPSHWEVKKIKYLVSNERNAIKPGPFGSDLKSSDIISRGIKVYTQQNVIKKDSDLGYDFVSTKKFSELKNFLAKEGDFLLSTRGTIGKVYQLPSNCENGIIHPCLIKFRIDKALVSSKIIDYVFNGCDIIQNQIRYMSNSTIIDVIYSDTLKNLSLPVCSIKEQNQIVNYLDKKTSQIENLISKKEELIETLKTYRTKLISETVTKGLDKDVPLKDSGVEWIGEIPEHWCVCKLKHVLKSKITDGPHETPIWVEDGIPFLSAEAIVNSEISINNMRGYISESQYEEYSKKSKVYKNDILFCKSGSTTGKSALVKTDNIFGIWSPLAIIRSDENKLHYSNLFYFIQSEYFIRQVVNYWSFGTQPNIGMGTLENLYITYSKNIDEQVEIVKFLDNEIKKIDTLTSKIEEQIENLKKAKQKLITEVVTGKIDVRHEI